MPNISLIFYWLGVYLLNMRIIFNFWLLGIFAVIYRTTNLLEQFHLTFLVFQIFRNCKYLLFYLFILQQTVSYTISKTRFTRNHLISCAHCISDLVVAREMLIFFSFIFHTESIMLLIKWLFTHILSGRSLANNSLNGTVSSTIWQDKNFDAERFLL